MSIQEIVREDPILVQSCENRINPQICNLPYEICSLPYEMFVEIFSYLNPMEGWGSVDLTCKSFHVILSSRIMRKTFSDMFGITGELSKDEIIEMVRKTVKITSSINYSGNLYQQNSRHFVGRQNKLNQMKQYLDISGFVVLQGEEGMGKTELVCEYLLRNFKQYQNGPCGVCWVFDSSNEIALRESFKKFAESFIGLVCPYERLCSSDEIEEQIKKVKEVIQYANNFLFVFDNLENKQLLSKYLPKVFFSHVIVTTRDESRYEKSIEIGPFTPEEGISLCYLYDQFFRDEDEINLFLEKLHYHPRTIRRAIIYMSYVSNAQELLEILEKKGNMDFFDSEEYDIKTRYGK